MVKFTDTMVCFREIPDYVTLAINISNCQNNCKNCHSPELRGDIGEILDEDKLEALIKENDGINCLCFMGEGKDWHEIVDLANYLRKTHPFLRLAIYSGRDIVPNIYYDTFDFVKVGHYDEKLGPLDKETTNQRLYAINDDGIFDITYKFWKNTVV